MSGFFCVSALQKTFIRITSNFAKTLRVLSHKEQPSWFSEKTLTIFWIFQNLELWEHSHRYPCAGEGNLLMDLSFAWVWNVGHRRSLCYTLRVMRILRFNVLSDHRSKTKKRHIYLWENGGPFNVLIDHRSKTKKFTFIFGKTEDHKYSRCFTVLLHVRCKEIFALILENMCLPFALLSACSHQFPVWRAGHVSSPQLDGILQNNRQSLMWHEVS